MSRQHGVTQEMFSQIMTRAAANGISESVVRLALILVNAMSRRPWHRAVEANFANEWMVSGARSNLIGMMRLIVHFANSEGLILNWGEKGEKIDFSDDGRSFLNQYGIEWGAAASILCQHRDTCGKSFPSVDTEEEDRIVYSVLPALIGQATWNSGCIGRVDGCSILKAIGGNRLTSGAKIDGIENWIGALDFAQVLYTSSGFLMRLDTDPGALSKIVQLPFESVDWQELFTGAVIKQDRPKATSPQVKLVPKPPAVETLEELPEVPDYVQGNVRNVLEDLYIQAIAGELIDEELRADLALKEVQLKAEHFRRELQEAEDALALAQGRSEAAKKDFADSFPVRKKASQTYLQALEILRKRHEADEELSALGINPEP